MNFAVIDLGTNTFNLLISEKLLDNTFVKIFNTKIPVKLGEGTINNGYIDKAPFERGIDALLKYKKYIDKYNVTQVYAFGTSALRSASNGCDFIKEAKEKCGIIVQIIDGEEEADLIYYGNRMAVKMTDDISLIMDIGGGSTEFILANKHKIFWKQSFLLGAARLLCKFKPSNPITVSEIKTFNHYLHQELRPLFDAIKKYQPSELIGSSGAFDSVVEMIAEEFCIPPTMKLFPEHNIDLTQYQKIYDTLIFSTLEQRLKIKGLVTMRADMMVISMLLIDYVLKEFKLQKIRVSDYSLKEGVISKKLGLTAA